MSQDYMSLVRANLARAQALKDAERAVEARRDRGARICLIIFLIGIFAVFAICGEQSINF